MDYTYAVLLLHKVRREVNEETLTKVIVATDVEIDETKIKSLITSLQDVNISKELEKVKLSTVTPIVEKPKEEIIEEVKEEKKLATEGMWDMFG